MLRVLQALFVIFLILLFGWRTQAMEARLSIPPNFADDISLSADMTAASSFKVVQSKIKEECSVKLSSDHEKKGGAILGEIERVLEQFYCAKAVPATEANSCGNISPKSYNWSVVDDLQDGRSALGSLQHKAESGEIFRSNGRVGFRFMKINNNTVSNEDHIVLCEVRVVNGIAGPPNNCGTVAIINENTVLLRAEVLRLDSLGCPLSAHFRLDLTTLDIDFTIKTVQQISLFSDTFGKLLLEELKLQRSKSRSGRMLIKCLPFTLDALPRSETHSYFLRVGGSPLTLI